jgi:uncharacterized membrane protein YccC
MLGVRTAIATVAPLLLTHWIGAEAASWASTGGFTVALSDKGGSYRTRALSMGAVTIGAMVAVALGSLAAGHAGAAVAMMLAWATLCSFAGVLGDVAAGAGNTAAVLFAVAVASGAATPHMAGERALAILGSGAWAMVLGLLFWPIRVYRPARYAVARCFRVLAQQADALAPQGHGAARAAIEEARQVLAATRRGRLGESGRGARLLVLLQIADLMYVTIVSLEEVIDSALVGGAPVDVCAEMERGLSRLAGALRDLAGRIETERRLPPAPAFDWGGESLRATLARAVPGASALAAARSRAWVSHCEQAVVLMARLGDDLRTAFETAATLYDDSRPRDLRPEVAESELVAQSPPLLELVRQELTWQSALLRHALRVGVVTGVAVVLTRSLGLSHGYWVTLAVLILLQPYTPATFTKALQRVSGTVLGGVLAALLVRVVHDRTALMAAATLLAGVSAAVLQLNYALFALFLTPTFVLLAEVADDDPHTVAIRIVNTVLGGVLALAGARLLWPHHERKRFPDEMANAIGALHAYFDEMVRVLGSGAAPGTVAALRSARRRFGVETNQAEESFQRLLAESRGGNEALEPYMTLLLFARRFAAMIGATAAARSVVAAVSSPEEPSAEQAQTEAALAALAREVDRVLEALEAAVRARRLPPPLPALDEAAARVGSPVLAARFSRLALQLTVLHHAVARCGKVSLTRV